MKIAVTRFDYLRRGGQAWVCLEGDLPDSNLDTTPRLKMHMHFAVRATQSVPATDDQIVVPHPIVAGLHIVAWFPSADEKTADTQIWPERNAYRFKAVQLVANLIATAELDVFGSHIPTIIA
ncbi:hypothetical protein SAMN05414139_10765 [Burkholderia sp. D7]|nr:hypothetical protein SAMN05414139_10765 [Burkholderia sp. D7]